MKYLALGVLLASFTCTTHADSPNETPAHLYRVGIGNEITAPGEVYAGDALYALFEKQNEKWKILNVSFSPPKVTNAPVQEVLVFSNDFTIVEPYFLPYIDWLGAKYNHKWSSSDRGIYSCARVYSREDRPLYNPCESSLTSIDNAVASAALQTLAGVMSMGLTVAGGATGWDYRVDPDKVKKLVTESGAIDEVRQKQIVLYAEKKLNDYRMSYQAATSAQSLKAFIAKYASYDPDSLLPKVRENLLQIEEREALAAKLKAKQDAERAAQREKEIAEINRLNAMFEKQNAKKWRILLWSEIPPTKSVDGPLLVSMTI